MPPVILFDASRLLSRTERSTPTGIDRVCLAYAEWLMAHPDYQILPVRGRKGYPALVDASWFEDRVKELRQRWSGGTASALRPRDEALFSHLRQVTRPTSSLREDVPAQTPSSKSKPKNRALRQYFRTRRVEALPQALAYLNVGHTGLDEPELLKAVKSSGIAPIIMVHDLIPITHPEYCREGDDAKHKKRILHTLTYAAHVIANSQYTADELIKFATATDARPVPVTVAHLGVEAQLAQSEPFTTSRPYFVYVGTIEARKNLAFLLTVWRRLEETLGSDAPSLVIAGRFGWENESVIDLLERSPNLQGLVHQISGLSDTALAALMKGARAVVAPSSVEGFDLPAVEACALGLPLLASDIPPHRELTPNARLIDPIDGLGWLDAIIDWTKSAPPTAAGNAPNWPDHFKIVEQEILSPLAGKLRGS